MKKPESPANIKHICAKHADERLQQWQAMHQHTVILPGDCVKASFNEEHMWLIVKEISGDLIKGTLDNDPIREINKNLFCGQEICISRAQVCDHMPKNAD